MSVASVLKERVFITMTLEIIIERVPEGQPSRSSSSSLRTAPSSSDSFSGSSSSDSLSGRSRETRDEPAPSTSGTGKHRALKRPHTNEESEGSKKKKSAGAQKKGASECPLAKEELADTKKLSKEQFEVFLEEKGFTEEEKVKCRVERRKESNRVSTFFTMPLCEHDQYYKTF